MNTFLLGLLLHRQSDVCVGEEEFGSLLDELRAVALKHGYSLGEYEALGMPGEHFPIGPCSRCRHLTLGWSPTPEELDEDDLLLRFLPRAIHHGRTVGDGFLCCECQEYPDGRA